MIRLATELMQAVMGDNDDEAGGLNLSAIRETGTDRILSIHVTPIDMIDDEAVPRYISAQPDSVSSH